MSLVRVAWRRRLMSVFLCVACREPAYVTQPSNSEGPAKSTALATGSSSSMRRTERDAAVDEVDVPSPAQVPAEQTPVEQTSTSARSGAALPPCLSPTELTTTGSREPLPQGCLYDAVAASNWLASRPIPDGANRDRTQRRPVEFGELEGKLIAFRDVRLVLWYPSSMAGWEYPAPIAPCDNFYRLPVALRWGATSLPLRPSSHAPPFVCRKRWLPTAERKPPAGRRVVDTCWPGDCPPWLWARGTLVAQATPDGFVLVWSAAPFHFSELR
jgi:hypothetical protein